jgi:hypothetical protein
MAEQAAMEVDKRSPFEALPPVVKGSVEADSDSDSGSDFEPDADSGSAAAKPSAPEDQAETLRSFCVVLDLHNCFVMFM